MKKNRGPANRIDPLLDTDHPDYGAPGVGRWPEGRFTVTCEDGAVRHDPFRTRREAQEWAEWGHCCTAHHEVTPAKACEGGDEAHRAHLTLNGECPWCGRYDPSAIDPNAEPEDFG